MIRRGFRSKLYDNYRKEHQNSSYKDLGPHIRFEAWSVRKELPLKKFGG